MVDQLCRSDANFGFRAMHGRCRCFFVSLAPCGLRVVRIDPLRFLTLPYGVEECSYSHLLLRNPNPSQFDRPCIGHSSLIGTVSHCIPQYPIYAQGTQQSEFLEGDTSIRVSPCSIFGVPTTPTPDSSGIDATVNGTCMHRLRILSAERRLKGEGKIHYTPQQSLGGCSSPSSRP